MPAIEKGDTVLVTGANGFIATHVIDQLLAAGYRVRGTARTEAKGKWVKDYFTEKYGGRFELALIPDLTVEGAFNEAVKDVHGIAHIASILTFDKDPNAVIPGVIAFQNRILEAAEQSPSVKRFVFTSSSTAATNPKPNVKFSIDDNTWNNESVDAAWAPPPYENARAWDVYGASKTQAEQTLWKFVRERRPHFEVNSVLPNSNFGPVIDVQEQASAITPGWIVALYEGKTAVVQDIPPQWFVDVQDTARLHVSALANPGIVNERIFAFAAPYTWNELLRVLRELRPDHTFPEDFKDQSQDLSAVVPHKRAEEILKMDYQKGFTGLKESLRQNIAHL